eukprot:scaffold211_cov447-Prasinococcus_capsulatus_cf.AAC.1
MVVMLPPLLKGSGARPARCAAARSGGGRKGAPRAARGAPRGPQRPSFGGLERVGGATVAWRSRAPGRGAAGASRVRTSLCTGPFAGRIACGGALRQSVSRCGSGSAPGCPRPPPPRAGAGEHGAVWTVLDRNRVAAPGAGRPSTGYGIRPAAGCSSR